MGIKIGCLQFAPQLLDFQVNIEKANNLLGNVRKGELDLLILPEMCFSGYMFESKERIMPMVQKEKETIEWTTSTARRLHCCVQVGLPRQVGDGLCNSVCFAQPDGSVEFYDKHFLYEQDEHWATSGASFRSMRIQHLGNKKLGFGICMDVNPKAFEAPWDAYEFATFMSDNGAEILSLSMAWVWSPRSDPLNLAKYWVSRLEPLIMQNNSMVIIAIANRCGVESGTRFAGNSCVMKFEKGKANLLSILDEAEEALLLCNVE
ncbi:hypothetical protein SeMB42_g01922 [Synchytrium endobioticum]|uniref:CN hydrolase domain-containing protein n=1 Tax=Synchytrium endobioticum TaxID=286115 RepID=A0A507DCS9_9FUNG|nr:hypothetical protein SeLEV6574_g01922 [Synchytrium endobioticum]TPX51439.1 hypothetical protein SeMB42_g01922 [Synchytrium endobioticum]